mmetsp:Transcript_98369/g.317181  ORF Transcript_98369/g.317181 Transcript_98369/m.317181 type:complete len:778 (-) Transcript_98369:163-2496(-)
MSFKKAKVQELLEILVVAAKDVAVQPTNWETWSIAASAFKRLFFAQDDEHAAAEDWRLKVKAWGQNEVARTPWDERLCWLHGQARTLTLALKLHLETELRREVEAFAASSASAAGEPSVAADPVQRRRLKWCRWLAQHWLAKTLDLLQLTRCRVKALSRGSLWVGKHEGGRKQDDKGVTEEHVWLTRQCDALARQLLWFLAQCTDMGPELKGTMQILQRGADSWPQPAFGKPWLAVSGAGKLFPSLMEFKAKGGGGGGAQVPQLLWFVPYIAARCQWQLAAVGLADLSIEDMLEMLDDACTVESWIRRANVDAAAQLAGGVAQRKKQVVEPHWRMVVTRLNIVLQMPEKWQIASKHTFHATPGSGAQVFMDCLKALDFLQTLDTYYKAKLVFRRARQAEAEGELEDAVKQVEMLFVYPKDFPQQGAGKVGIGLYRVSDGGAGKTENPQVDPWLESKLQLRSHNCARARIMFFILDLYRRILEDVMPITVVNAVRWEMHESEMLPPLPSPNAEAKVGADLKTAAKSIMSLSDNLPRGWEALRSMIGFLVSLTRGLHNNQANSFWLAFHEAFGRALRQAFAVLVRAGYAKGAKKPSFDWSLLAMLRCYWFSLEGNRQTSAKDLAELRKMVAGCYIAAAEQVRMHAAVRQPATPTAKATAALGGANGAALTQKLKRGVEAAEAFYQAILPHMPSGVLRGMWGSSDEAAPPPQPKQPPATAVAATKAAVLAAAAAGAVAGVTAAAASFGSGRTSSGTAVAAAKAPGTEAIMLVDSDVEDEK